MSKLDERIICDNCHIDITDFKMECWNCGGKVFVNEPGNAKPNLPTNLDEDIDDLMYLYKLAENDEVRDDAKARMKRLVQSICLSVIGETDDILRREKFDINEYRIRDELRAEQRLSLKEKIG